MGTYQGNTQNIGGRQLHGMGQSMESGWALIAQAAELVTMRAQTRIPLTQPHFKKLTTPNDQGRHSPVILPGIYTVYISICLARGAKFLCMDFDGGQNFSARTLGGQILVCAILGNEPTPLPTRKFCPLPK